MSAAIQDRPATAVSARSNDGESARADRWLPVAIGLITLGGVALRILGARGDLWLDEIWSLTLLENAHSVADVFLGVHHLNNHILNSLWLYLVGPDAPFLLIRAPAILFGGLSILVAAAIGRRRSPAAAVITSFFFATSYFFVNYGSEARGYSGMILAILSGYWAVLAMFDEAPGIWPYVVFGLAACLGALSHLTMIEATGVLCLTVLWISVERREKLIRSLERLALVSVIALLASLPAVGCFFYWKQFHDFETGGITPFEFTHMRLGLFNMTFGTLGLPNWADPVFLGAVVIAVAVFGFAIAPPMRRCFPALAIFALPAFHALARLPSQFYARFHLTTAIGLGLLWSEVAVFLWTRNYRLWAIALMSFFASHQAAYVSEFLWNGRGEPSAIVRTMTEHGPARYDFLLSGNQSTENHDSIIDVAWVVNFYARRLSAQATLVSIATWCAKPPDWLIDESNDAPQPGQIKSAGPNECRANFRFVQMLNGTGYSFEPWVLYRRVGTDTP